ncbi:hypothetical protein [Neomicrococcus lactis]|uniref:Uncharacterized protein n=1 Tax=Neomicrococcus lactis TaxID=732241 RepID=A0A7W8YCM7_9MICC|nr:hypothetical protein [Neomicrococcus lactis]MBB5599081.1 hypothetical protein [Neomicrococcus lactis]
MDFYKDVIAVSNATKVHPDTVTLNMYTDGVRQDLGELPTPPWYINQDGSLKED